MRITKLKIQLIKNQQSLSDHCQEHFLLLPVDLKLTRNQTEPDLFEIDQLFTIVVDDALFAQYGTVQISRYGSFSRQQRRLPGISNTKSNMEITWLVRGYAKTDGSASIKFGFRGTDFRNPDNATTPHEVRRLDEGHLVTEFEIEE